MHDTLLYLAIANLVTCIVVGMMLFFGVRKIRKVKDVNPPSGQPLPKVSLIVAARNEERNIETALRSLLQLDYENLDILVVDDRSTDQTGAILDRIAGDNPRLRVEHLTELPSGWLGKNHALRHGASLVDGELLLFTDADVVMEPSVLRRAVHYMIDNGVDHLPMLFRIQMPNWLLESFVVTFSIYLMSYCRPWRCPKPKSSACIGVGGFNLIRSDVYRRIGTHEAIRMRPDDDLKLGKLVKKHGARQELLDASDLMYVPWYSSLRELVGGLEKNAFSSVNYRVSYVLIVTSSMLVFNVFPFVAVFVTDGVTRIIYTVVVAILLLVACDSAYHGKARLSCCLGFPVAALMFVLIILRTVTVNLIHGGIRWRDTFYSLAELKANKV